VSWLPTRNRCIGSDPPSAISQAFRPRSRRTWETPSASQFGGTAPTAKTWKGLGPGVLEIVESHDGNAYRAVYTVRLEKAVYVLHAFEKKSPSGIRTAKRDVDLAAERLKTAERDHEDGKSKR
jgi:phage-related protein